MKITDNIEQSSATFFLYGERNTKLSDFYLNISNLLRFPSYFGNNLDALEECLADLSWLPFDEINIIIDEFNQLLADEEESVREAVISIFECVENSNERICFLVKK